MQLVKIFILVLCSFGFLKSGPWSKKLETKIYNAIHSTYEVDDAELSPIKIEPDLENAIKSEINGCLFQVKTTGLQGYVYINQAPSMKNVFDYIILFDDDLNILKSKVLIYREKHGRQIGTKRWLDQFNGLGENDEAVLGKNIDGITGATISAKSMTHAVNEVLSSLARLKAEGVFENE